MMMNDSEYVLNIDERPAIAAVDRANASVDGHGKRVVAINQDIAKSYQAQGEIIATTSDRTNSLMVRQHAQMLQQHDLMLRQSATFKQIGDAANNYLSGTAAAIKGTIEFASAIAIGTKAIAAHTTVMGLYEAAVWRVRAAEVGVAGVTEGLGGAITAAGGIGAIVLAEKVISTTYARAQELTKQAVEAQRTGLSYQAVVERDFATQRIGQSGDFFDSAVKSAGGVDQLAAKLRELGEVRDPIDRVRQAFDAFGSDAGKMLPFLDSQFENNIRMVREWGLVLDQASREHIDTFRRDVDSLKDTFHGLGSEMEAWSKSVGNYMASGFASFYATLRDIPGFVQSKLPKFQEGYLIPGGAKRGGLTLGSLLGMGDVDPDLSPNRQLRQGAPGDALRFVDVPNANAEAMQARALKLATDISSGNLVEALKAYTGQGTKYFLQGEDRDSELKTRVSTLRKQLFVSDMTSPDYGKLVPAASFPGGYLKREQALQSFVTSQDRVNQNKADKEAKDAAEASAKAGAAAFESLVKSVESSTKALKAQVEDFGAGPTERLFNQRRRQLSDYRSQGAPAGLVGQYDSQELSLIRLTAKQEGGNNAEKDRQYEEFLRTLRPSTETNLYTDFNFGAERKIAEGIREYKESTAADRAIENIGLETERMGLQRGASRAQRIAVLDTDNPATLAAKSYDVQIGLAKDLFNADLRRAEFEKDEYKQSVDRAKAYADLERTNADARIEHELKIKEIEKQRGDQFKSTFAEGALSIQSGTFGQFLKGQAASIEHKMLENVGGMIFDKNKGRLSGTALDPNSTLGKLFEGTWFGGKGDSKIPVVSSQMGPAVPVIIANLPSASNGPVPAHAALALALQNLPAAGGGLAHIAGIAPGLGAILKAARMATGYGNGGSTGPAGVVSTNVSYPGFDSSSSQGWSSLVGNIGPGGTAGFAQGSLGIGDGSGSASGSAGGVGGPIGVLKAALSGMSGGGSSSGTVGTLAKLKGMIGGGLGSVKELFGLGDSVKGGFFHLGDKLGAIGHSTGTALLGAGLAYDGLRRGGIGGLLETTAGGAAIGFKFGGPIGAAIGAGIGALAGTARLFIKGFDQQVRDQIKQAYGIDIRDKAFLQQISAQIKQSYGGSISVGIHSPQLRDLIFLYGQNTQQKIPFLDKPLGVSAQDFNGSLSQNPTYMGGASYGFTGGSVGVNGSFDNSIVRGTGQGASSTVTHISVSLDGNSSAQFLQGQTVNAINDNPRIVQSAGINASLTNSGRQDQARLGLSPFSLTS